MYLLTGHMLVRLLYLNLDLNFSILQASRNSEITINCALTKMVVTTTFLLRSFNGGYVEKYLCSSISLLRKQVKLRTF